MDLNDKIKDWEEQITKAEEYGYHFDVETVKDMMTELKQVKKDYEELADATIE